MKGSMVDHGFYFYQILATFNKLKIMSEVVDDKKKYQNYLQLS
jgi:hypothetical protein